MLHWLPVKLPEPEKPVPSDWLLRAEVAELRGEVPSRREAAHA